MCQKPKGPLTGPFVILGVWKRIGRKQNMEDLEKLLLERTLLTI